MKGKSWTETAPTGLKVAATIVRAPSAGAPEPFGAQVVALSAAGSAACRLQCVKAA